MLALTLVAANAYAKPNGNGNSQAYGNSAGNTVQAHEKAGQGNVAAGSMRQDRQNTRTRQQIHTPNDAGPAIQTRAKKREGSGENGGEAGERNANGNGPRDGNRGGGDG